MSTGCLPPLPPRRTADLGTVPGLAPKVVYQHRVVARSCDGHMKVFEGGVSSTGERGPLDDQLAERARRQLAQNPQLGSNWTLTWEAVPQHSRSDAAGTLRLFDSTSGGKAMEFDLDPARANSKRAAAGAALQEAREMTAAFRPAQRMRAGENGRLHSDHAGNAAHLRDFQTRLGAVLDRAESSLMEAIGHHVGFRGRIQLPNPNWSRSHPEAASNVMVFANASLLFKWPVSNNGGTDWTRPNNAVMCRLAALNELHARLGSSPLPWQ